MNTFEALLVIVLVAYIAVVLAWAAIGIFVLAVKVLAGLFARKRKDP